MKINIGLFFGGMSVEHEVSIISGIQAFHAFDKEKYQVIPIYITKDNEMYTGEGISEIREYRDIPKLLSKSTRIILVSEKGRCKIIQYPAKRFGNSCLGEIDVAFPVVHGTNVEDGTLQGMLSMLKVPFAGPDLTSSALCMDKYAMKVVLAARGIPVLDGSSIDLSRYRTEPESVMEELEQAYSYPMIVKPINLGSSIGIRIARDRRSLGEALDHAFGFAMQVVVERAIVHLREINCSVLGDHQQAEASECEEPINSSEILSYEDKYMSGGSSAKGQPGSKTGGSRKSGGAGPGRIIPADLPAETRERIRELAVQTFQVLNCNGVARVDFMIDEDTGQILVNEINTIPGSLSFYLWEPVGVPYPQLVDRMVELALKRERELSQLSFSFQTNLLQHAELSGTKGAK